MSDRETSIADLELRIGYRLPEDYRRFLLERRPERWDDEGYEPVGGGDSYSFSILRSLIGLDKLADNREMYKGRMPETLLPITYDPFGNPVCLALAGEEFGKIYFCDHESEGEPEEQPYWENTTEMDASFREFLDDLYQRSGECPDANRESPS